MVTYLTIRSTCCGAILSLVGVVIVDLILCVLDVFNVFGLGVVLTFLRHWAFVAHFVLGGASAAQRLPCGGGSGHGQVGVFIFLAPCLAFRNPRLLPGRCRALAL